MQRYNFFDSIIKFYERRRDGGIV